MEDAGRNDLEDKLGAFQAGQVRPADLFRFGHENEFGRLETGLSQHSVDFMLEQKIAPVFLRPLKNLVDIFKVDRHSGILMAMPRRFSPWQSDAAISRAARGDSSLCSE
jgi:hypothetical protein